MIKLLLTCALCALAFTACEQQKQASAEVGAVPKQMLDKAKSDIQKAEALAAESTKALENLDTPVAAE